MAKVYEFIVSIADVLGRVHCCSWVDRDESDLLYRQELAGPAAGGDVIKFKHTLVAVLS